jgi:hypothetical protein
MIYLKGNSSGWRKRVMLRFGERFVKSRHAWICPFSGRIMVDAE